MPKITTTTNLDPAIEYALGELDKFSDPAGWRTSRRGNRWRLWEGKTVTVFVRTDEFYGWSIADDEGTRFSRGGYESEDEAKDALAEALGIGW